MLDVVIPVFDTSKELLQAAFMSATECIRAARALEVGTDSPLGRVVLVDDGSKIPLSREGLDGKDVVFEVIRQDNAGPSIARNRGMDATTAPWVLLLDSDDVALPEGVIIMMGLAQRLRAQAAIGARVHFSDAGFEELKPVPAEWKDRVLPVAGDVFRPISLFSSTGVLLSRQAVQEVRFDPSLFVVEDREFFYQLAARWPLAICGDPVVRYRVHASDANNLSSAKHLARRTQGHITLIERHLDTQSAQHFEAGTRWLVNAIARTRGKQRVDDDTWNRLLEVCKRNRWAVPAKARLRRWWSSFA